MDELLKRIAELEAKLTALGDLAVADWHDTVVGEVDATLPHEVRLKYADLLRVLFVQNPTRIAELERDNARLREALKRIRDEDHEYRDSEWRIANEALLILPNAKDETRR